MLRRLAFVAMAAGVAAVIASPAAANSTVPINSGNIDKPNGTLATGHQCDIGNGPYSDHDVWVFVLPGPDAGKFVTVTASYDTNGDGSADTDVTIPTGVYPSGFVQDKNAQAPKAWIALPEGWALKGASAVITGTADKFNLTHTCAAGSSPTPSGSPTPVPSTPVSGTPTPGTGTPTPGVGTSESPGTGTPTPGNGTPTPGGGTSETPGAGTPHPSASSGGGLPTTGVALTSYALTALALIGAGTFALLAARRRRSGGAHAKA